MNLRLQLLTTTELLHSLEPEWNILLQQSSANSIFMTWEWISTWWTCFGSGRQLRLLVVRQPDSEQLLALVPLCLREYALFGLRYRELAFLGSGVAAPDHLDFIIKTGWEQTIVPIIVDYLEKNRSEWDGLRLEGMVEESLTAAAIMQQFPFQPYQKRAVSCPFIPLPENWETYRQGLGKNMRSNIGRYGRQLEQAYPGQVIYRQVTHPADLAAALSGLFRLHQEVQQAQGHPGAFKDKRMVEFHQRLASQFLHNGWLRFYLLTVGSEDIAAIYCYRYGERVSFYQTGYDSKWSRYGPGRQIMAYAIQKSIEEKAKEFDFLRGDEAYKFNWTEQNRADLEVRLASDRLGQLAVDAYILARWVRAKLRRKKRVL